MINTFEVSFSPACTPSSGIMSEKFFLSATQTKKPHPNQETKEITYIYTAHGRFVYLYSIDYSIVSYSIR